MNMYKMYMPSENIIVKFVKCIWVNNYLISNYQSQILIKSFENSTLSVNGYKKEKNNGTEVCSISNHFTIP